MKRNLIKAFIAGGLAVLLAGSQAGAQCLELTSGLRRPIGTALTNQGNLVVSETGTTPPDTGRISLVDTSGNRRTLLDGLPSGISDAGDISGPDGLFMRGRTLYVAIGTGDVGRPGPFPGTTIPNPNPISSPIFSSILAIQFSTDVEKITNGFTLTLANQQTLASGQTVTLVNQTADRIMIKMVADFPNYVPFPLPFFPDNVQLSNPFGLVAVEDMLYVTDGGRNLVWRVDLLTDSFSMLAAFPNIPNPVFPTFGGPFLQPVPTGIASSNNQLLVALFRGFPFPPSTSTVEQVDPLTGGHSAFISGLRTAIAVLPMSEDEDTSYLVLQHTSGDVILPPFSGPGLLLRFATPDGPPTVLASCLTRPTSMTLNKKTNTLYVSELAGRIVAIPITP